MNTISVPEQFLCPITLELMEDPVICEDGNNYERQSIIECLKKKPVSPLTNLPINTKIIIPNRGLKELITQFKIDRDNQRNKKINIPVNINKNTNNNMNNNMDFIDDDSQRLINELINEETEDNNIEYNNQNINLNNMEKIDIEDIFKNIRGIPQNNDIFYEYIASNIDQINKFSQDMNNQDINQLNLLINNGNNIHKSFYVYAILHKLPKVIKWLATNNCVIGEESMNLAVTYGDYNLIFWLLKNDCKWDIYTFSHAIESKNINFLNWIYEKGCYWGILLDNHLTIIQQNRQIRNWLKSKKCSWYI